MKLQGDQGYQALVPWLKEKMISESNTVDRSGAAQGLSEIIFAMGNEKLHEIVPEILAIAQSDVPPHVRDGYCMTFVYLPGLFGDEFVRYLTSVIPCLLKVKKVEIDVFLP